jgi:hypothetical protein
MTLVFLLWFFLVLSIWTQDWFYFLTSTFTIDLIVSIIAESEKGNYGSQIDEPLDSKFPIHSNP